MLDPIAETQGAYNNETDINSTQAPWNKRDASTSSRDSNRLTRGVPHYIIGVGASMEPPPRPRQYVQQPITAQPFFFWPNPHPPLLPSLPVDQTTQVPLTLPSKIRPKPFNRSTKNRRGRGRVNAALPDNPSIGVHNVTTSFSEPNMDKRHPSSFQQLEKVFALHTLLNAID